MSRYLAVQNCFISVPATMLTGKYRKLEGNLWSDDLTGENVKVEIGTLILSGAQFEAVYPKTKEGKLIRLGVLANLENPQATKPHTNLETVLGDVAAKARNDYGIFTLEQIADEKDVQPSILDFHPTTASLETGGQFLEVAQKIPMRVALLRLTDDARGGYAIVDEWINAAKIEIEKNLPAETDAPCAPEISHGLPDA